MNKTPRQKRHKKTKQAILQVAEALVIREGYQSISLRAIAREADYSPSGLYEYFESKEMLFQQLALQLESRIIDTLNQVPSELSPHDHLLALSENYIDFALNNQRLYQLMSSMPSVRSSLNQSPQSRSPYSIMLDAIRNLVDSWGKESSHFELEQITYGLWALAHGIISLRLTYLIDFDADFKLANRNNLIMFIKGVQSQVSK